ncbi:MAG: 2-oxo acid dehydrogenase subunit E2 [Gemmatimonadetes bacterium]|nr:2-oxo acid dehydrogenase subunit E2 [Gemmatimonadota bacterium]
MPQMGESIAEGTVSKWLKKVGDSVERDEPILEISTDKVDAEIPAPQSGILVEVSVQEGETVEVGTVVAYIDTSARVAVPAKGEEASAAKQEQPRAAAPAAAPQPPSGDGEMTEEQRIRQRSTPVVRRMAEEHGVDLASLEGKGSGHAGRVTKQDLLQYLGQEGEASVGSPPPPAKAAPGAPSISKPAPSIVPSSPVAAPRASPAASPALPPSEFWKTFYSQVQNPEFPVREGDEVVTMDKIRRLTAEHMTLAKRIAPHVHTFIEIDFTKVDGLRKANAKKWQEQGARVSFTAFVAWAVSRLLREFPIVNATVSGNNVIYRGHVNIGIAVDLDPGLIVPVIRDADDLSLVGIGKKVVDLADRARKRALSPEEIQGATFTITNPGVLGTLVGLPIIPKGTAAILGTGAIEKRVVVVEDPATGQDSMAIRKRTIFSLGYDHRIVDGADGARFLARLKQLLEEFPDDA